MVYAPTFKPLTSPDLESLLIPQWIEYHALHSPDHILFAHETALGSGEIATINWKEMHVRCIKAAEYVTPLIGPSQQVNVVAILANIDSITFFSIIGGLWLTGATPFLISTRNSAAAVAHLIGRTNVSALFVSPDEQIQSLFHAAMDILVASDDKEKGSNIKILSTPKCSDLYCSRPEGGERYLYPLPSHVNFASPAIILHSSGSTSFPKPITITHSNLRQRATLAFEPDANQTVFSQRMAIHALPGFHVMGFETFINAIATGMSLGVFPPSEPPVVPSPDNYVASAIATKCDIMYTVPRFLEQWSKKREYVDTLRTLKTIYYAGAPLSRTAGKLLVDKGVKITNYYGSTELGIVTAYWYSPYSEWEWVTHAQRMNVYYRPVDLSLGQFELVYLEGPSHTPAVLDTEVDGVQGFETKDLVIRHPTNPMKFKLLGRTDDQLMLSTGEKTNPGPIEAIIARNPLVLACLMFGRGRDQNGIIIQPVSPINPGDEPAVIEFRNAIWSSVEDANAFAPTHSRLFKEMIILTHPNKPFRFTAKQSVIRKASLADYEDEVERLYATVAESAHKDIVGPEDWTSREDVHAFVRRVFSKVMEKELSDEADLFVQGGDSLRATWLRNSLMHALRQSSYAALAKEIGQSFVYNYPSVAQCSAAISSLVEKSKSSQISTTAEINIQQRVETIEALVAEFTADFPSHRADSDRFKGPVDGSEAVIVTGTTGGLGAQLLATLASDASVKKIYAVNRSSQKSLEERQRVALLERGIDESILERGKIVLVEGNTENANLGITTNLYQEMRESVTMVIHNAWRVNFVLQVASYRPLLQGTRNIVDFCISSPRATPPRIIYTSSVSLFSNWTSDEAPSEDAIPASSAVGNGYGESKYIVERILQAASQVTALRPVSVRIGQMTGTVAGAWNNTDWVPAIVRSGQVLGVLPDRGDNVAWLPLDLAARALFEFRSSANMHLNLAHPAPYSWSAIFQEFSKQLNIPLVSWAEWLDKLEEMNVKDPENKLRNPAALLIPFFRTAVVEADPKREAPGIIPFMSMQKALADSESLRQAVLEPFETEVSVHKWVAHWKATGLLE